LTPKIQNVRAPLIKCWGWGSLCIVVSVVLE